MTDRATCEPLDDALRIDIIGTLTCAVLIHAHVTVLQEEDAGGQGRIRGAPSSLKTIMPPSWPAASRFESWCAGDPEAIVSWRKVCTPCFDMSQTRMDLSSELETMSSCFGWNNARDVINVAAQCVDLPRFRLIHAPQLDLSVVRTGHNKREGMWKDAQLTPRSWPLDVLTVASLPPKGPPPVEERSARERSVSQSRKAAGRGVRVLHCTPTTFGIAFPLSCEAGAAGGHLYRRGRRGALLRRHVFGSSFFRNPEMSQTLTVWSRRRARGRPCRGIART